MKIKDFSKPLEGNYRIERDNGHNIVNAYWIKERIAECETLRQQLAVTKEENEQVRQANLDVMMHFEDMKAAKEKAETRVAELEGSIKHAIGWIDGDLRELIRDMGNTVCTYNDLYDAADRIEAILAQSLSQQADEAERAGGEK